MADADRSTDAATGRGGWRLRGYVVEELLGRGGSAAVYRARVAATGQKVALKRLPVRDDVQVRRAAAEAAKLSVLEHPHLVRLHGLVPQRDEVVLVLDLAERGSLADVLAARGRLTPGEVITAIAPVGAALAHVHAAGIVHGDVTPANILFTAGGNALLADLGVARLTGDHADAESTPAYVDPGVAAGGIPSELSDVFMLAATALHALTGELPWPGPTPAQALEQARTGDLYDLPGRLDEAGVPAGMAAVVCRALDLDPARRGTAAGFALDLRHSGVPVAVELGAGRARPEPAAPPVVPAADTHQKDEPVGAAISAATPRPPRGRHAAASPDRVSRRPRALWRRPGAAGPTGGRGAGRPAVRGVGAPVVVAPAVEAPVRIPPTTADVPSWSSTFAASRPALDGVAVSGAREARPAFDRPAFTASVRAASAPPPTSRVRPRPRPDLPPARRVRPVQWPRPRALLAAAIVAAALAAGGVAWSQHSATSVGAAPTAGRASPATEQTRPSDAPAAHPSSPSTTQQPAASSAIPPSFTDWIARLSALDALRARAFAERRAELLASVYASTQLQNADAAALERIVPAGCGLQGVHTAYRDVRLVSGATRQAVVEVTASLPASTLVCGGAARARAPAVGAARLRLTLTGDPATARIADERPV